MSSPSSVRGSAILTVGVAASLLFGVLSAGFASARQTDGLSAKALRAWFQGQASVEMVDPWFVAYDRLSSPNTTTELTARGVSWRVEQRPETCALLRAERAGSVEVASAKMDSCVIAGASIDGRFVTLGETERTKSWMLYDDRPRILRPVPRPVVDGEWMAIDPVRTVGLYRGRIRSTQSEGVSTWLWLTDGVGAAMWAGDQSVVDMDGPVVPLQLFTRPDGMILLAYRVALADGTYRERLAIYSGRLAVPWKRIDTSAIDSFASIWRVSSWERRTTTWEAVLEYEGEDGARKQVRVKTH